MIELKPNIIPELAAVLSAIYTAELAIFFLIITITPDIVTILFLIFFPLIFLAILLAVVIENKLKGEIYKISHNVIEFKQYCHAGHEINEHKKIRKIIITSSESSIIDENKKLIYERRSKGYIALFFLGLLGLLTIFGFTGFEIARFGIINSLYLEYWVDDVKYKKLLGCYSKKTILKIKELVPSLIIK